MRENIVIGSLARSSVARGDIGDVINLWEFDRGRWVKEEHGHLDVDDVGWSDETENADCLVSALYCQC